MRAIKTLEETEMFDFINDLDEFFCEKYANYDKLCVLKGYKMPKMHDSKILEDGRTYTYTLPSETMRLALQENKAELLALLKKNIDDKTFSFSFRPLPFFSKLKNVCSKKGFLKNFKRVLEKYNYTFETAAEEIEIAGNIWKKIQKGSYLPSKNLILSLALTLHLSVEETQVLLWLCGYEFDFTIVKDVVIYYLIEQKIFNATMQERAFEEYKIRNLFLKKEKTA